MAGSFLQAALDLLGRPGNTVRGALIAGPQGAVQGLTGERQFSGTDLPGINQLDDGGISLGPVHLSQRSVAGALGSAVLDPLTYVGGGLGKVGEGLLGLGRMGGAADDLFLSGASLPRELAEGFQAGVTHPHYLGVLQNKNFIDSLPGLPGGGEPGSRAADLWPDLHPLLRDHLGAQTYGDWVPGSLDAANSPLAGSRMATPGGEYRGLFQGSQQVGRQSDNLPGDLVQGNSPEQAEAATRLTLTKGKGVSDLDPQRAPDSEATPVGDQALAAQWGKRGKVVGGEFEPGTQRKIQVLDRYSDAPEDSPEAYRNITVKDMKPGSLEDLQNQVATIKQWMDLTSGSTEGAGVGVTRVSRQQIQNKLDALQAQLDTMSGSVDEKTRALEDIQGKRMVQQDPSLLQGAEHNVRANYENWAERNDRDTRPGLSAKQQAMAQSNAERQASLMTHLRNEPWYDTRGSGVRVDPDNASATRTDSAAQKYIDADRTDEPLDVADGENGGWASGHAATDMSGGTVGGKGFTADNPAVIAAAERAGMTVERLMARAANDMHFRQQMIADLEGVPGHPGYQTYLPGQKPGAVLDRAPSRSTGTPGRGSHINEAEDGSYRNYVTTGEKGGQEIPPETRVDEETGAVETVPDKSEGGSELGTIEARGRNGMDTAPRRPTPLDEYLAEIERMKISPEDLLMLAKHPQMLSAQTQQHVPLKFLQYIMRRPDVLRPGP